MYSLIRKNNLLRRKGIACVFALLFLVVLTSVALGMVSRVSVNLVQSENYADSLQAQNATESGLRFMMLFLRDVELPSGTTLSTLPTNLTDELNRLMEGTANLAGYTVTNDGLVVHVPSIPLQNAAFQCDLKAESGPEGQLRCRLIVTGTYKEAVTKASVAFDATVQRGAVFDYGIASRGQIFISGSAIVDGINENSEGSILSASNYPVAIDAGGSATIDGDLYVTGDESSSVHLYGGGLSVNGETDIDTILNEHVHLDVPDPVFPDVDVSPFKALTTTIIDSSTDLSGSVHVFNNPLIKAGTNPIFPNSTTINGVMYIEMPNQVKFSAGTYINGIIVTDDATDTDIANNQIVFTGHVTAPGVEALPDTPDFFAVKQLTGTVLLAPGFGVTFKGTTNTINGTIAADQLSFLGNSEITGSLSGSIIGLRDLAMTLQGNATIRLNRPPDGMLPAGFKHPLRLDLVASTYSEAD